MDDSHQQTPSQDARDPQGASGSASILVVDDSRVSALKLSKAMRALGHRTESASNGVEALRRLREQSFELVLLDLLALELSPDEKGLLEKSFRAIHTIKGNSGFVGYGQVESACMDLETVLDRLRLADAPVAQPEVSGMLVQLDALRRLLDPEAAESRLDDKPIGEILVEMGAAEEGDVAAALELQDKKVGEILGSFLEKKGLLSLVRSLPISHQQFDSFE